MEETLRTEIPDRLTPWFVLGQPTGYKPFSPERKNLEQQYASLFSLMETASWSLNWYQACCSQQLLDFRGGKKSYICCYQRLRIKTINLFPYLLTVLRTDMSYLTGSDLADDGKKERENQDFY